MRTITCYWREDGGGGGEGVRVRMHLPSPLACARCEHRGGKKERFDPPLCSLYNSIRGSSVSAI